MSFRSNGETLPKLDVVRDCDPSPFCESFPKFSLEWDYIYGLESGIPHCCVVEYCYRKHVLKQNVLKGIRIVLKQERLLGGNPFQFVLCTDHPREQTVRRARERLYRY